MGSYYREFSVKTNVLELENGKLLLELLSVGVLLLLPRCVELSKDGIENFQYIVWAIRLTVDSSNSLY